MSNHRFQRATPTRRVSRTLVAGAAVGAVLGAAYLFVHVKTAAVEARHPPRGAFITVDGVRLHYLEQGSGPVVVLVHANGVTADDFAASGLLARLAAGHRVIAFDRPGFGYSARPATGAWTPEAQAALLHRALDALQAHQPIVVGHGWGALVALAMALDAPARVHALALLGGCYYPSLRPHAYLETLAALPVLGTLWRHTAAPLLGRLHWPAVATAAFAPAPVPERFGLRSPWMALRPAQLLATAVDHGLTAPAVARLARRYHELAMPVTLVAGLGDQLTPVGKNSGRLQRELAHSDLSLQGGAGHMVHYTKSTKSWPPSPGCRSQCK